MTLFWISLTAILASGWYHEWFMKPDMNKITKDLLEHEKRALRAEAELVAEVQKSIEFQKKTLTENFSDTQKNNGVPFAMGVETCLEATEEIHGRAAANQVRSYLLKHKAYRPIAGMEENA